MRFERIQIQSLSPEFLELFLWVIKPESECVVRTVPLECAFANSLEGSLLAAESEQEERYRRREARNR